MRHTWARVGPAPDFRGYPCELWQCQGCGKTWELFEGITPTAHHQAHCKPPDAAEPDAPS